MFIDRKDAKILNLVQLDNRLSKSEIGDEVGLTHSGVSRRLQRLYDRSVIFANVALVSPETVGYSALTCPVRASGSAPTPTIVSRPLSRPTPWWSARTPFGERIMNMPDVIIIRAGVVGLSAAIAAQSRGLSVMVLDKVGPAAGASAGNAGAFAFSDILPRLALSRVDVVAAAYRGMTVLHDGRSRPGPFWLPPVFQPAV